MELHYDEVEGGHVINCEKCKKTIISINVGEKGCSFTIKKGAVTAYILCENCYMEGYSRE